MAPAWLGPVESPLWVETGHLASAAQADAGRLPLHLYEINSAGAVPEQVSIATGNPAEDIRKLYQAAK